MKFRSTILIWININFSWPSGFWCASCWPRLSWAEIYRHPKQEKSNALPRATDNHYSEYCLLLVWSVGWQSSPLKAVVIIAALKFVPVRQVMENLNQWKSASLSVTIGKYWMNFRFLCPTCTSDQFCNISEHKHLWRHGNSEKNSNIALMIHDWGRHCCLSPGHLLLWMCQV